jgi:hypothetical protein
MHALVLAALICPPVRLARVHLVDGMPFIDVLRPSLRATAHPDRSGPTAVNGFAITDGGREIAYLRFAPDGSVEVRGYVRVDPAGRFVDVDAPPGRGCPRAAISVTLRPTAS